MSNPQKPFISVIIPTYHDWARLKLCIDALKSQIYPAELFEVIIVNNGPEDIAPELNLPQNFQLISEAKPGSYAARNAALAIAKGDILAFTDSDCQPQADWLESAVKLFEVDPSVSRIGGKISLIMNGEKPTFAEMYEQAYAFRQQDFVRDKGMAATGNMIAKKGVFDCIGNFNEQLMSGGDAEWGIRAQVKGFDIVYSEACVVWHPTRSRLKEIVQKTKREAGGHFSLIKDQGIEKKILSILIGFLPPVKSMMRVFRDKNLTLKEKIISISIRYYLRLISTLERLKLLLALKNVERV